MNEPKEHDLTRFLDAQAGDFDVALQELVKGRKRSHWMWYIFPQVAAGLGLSWMSEKYAIRSREEAAAYLNHEVLGPRLRQCAAALLPHQGKSIAGMMSYPDNLKLRSSMTLLFCQLLNQCRVFSGTPIRYGKKTDLLDFNTICWLVGNRGDSDPSESFRHRRKIATKNGSSSRLTFAAGEPAQHNAKGHSSLPHPVHLASPSGGAMAWRYSSISRGG